MLTIFDIYTIHINHIGNICLLYYALKQFVNVARNNQVEILLMPNRLFLVLVISLTYVLWVMHSCCIVVSFCFELPS